MWPILLLEVLLVPLVAFQTHPPHWVPHYANCSSKPDGLLEFGCWGAIYCQAGLPNTVECQKDEVFDRHSKSCILYAGSAADHVTCRQPKPCPDHDELHRYADLEDKCETYYVCYGGSYLQRYYCPAGTVFNNKLQTCDWPGDTLPPCGTRTW
ncbi:chitin-binding domain protein cbd-1-like [Gigantopelta aegis]|uniref:chitin-binding domain protein cbd-1-like n=1 Tax=Gigantopelta aegis TaxID=1735272 RepID=UPI001B889311|nr:chitin-binding domain protein cbd-1-like [Gigantopelta aegis]